MKLERDAAVGWSRSAAAPTRSLLLLLIYPSGARKSYPCGGMVLLWVVTGQPYLGAGCGIYHLCTTHNWIDPHFDVCASAAVRWDMF